MKPTMRFRISDNKVVRNEIMQEGAMFALLTSRRREEDTIVYYGDILFGTLSRASHVEQVSPILRINHYKFDFFADRNYRDVSFPETTGYENDTSTKLVFAERLS